MFNVLILNHKADCHNYKFKLFIAMDLRCSHSKYFCSFSNYVFKNVVDVTLLPLTHLINIVLSDSVFQTLLNFVKLHLFLKKGQRELPENYPPITLIYVK